MIHHQGATPNTRTLHGLRLLRPFLAVQEHVQRLNRYQRLSPTTPVTLIPPTSTSDHIFGQNHQWKNCPRRRPPLGLLPASWLPPPPRQFYRRRTNTQLPPCIRRRSTPPPPPPRRFFRARINTQLPLRTRRRSTPHQPPPRRFSRSRNNTPLPSCTQRRSTPHLPLRTRLRKPRWSSTLSADAQSRHQAPGSRSYESAETSNNKSQRPHPRFLCHAISKPLQEAYRRLDFLIKTIK